MSKTAIKALLILFTLSISQLSAQNFYKQQIARDNIFSIGVGPSFAYMDNGGQYKAMNFEIKPSISASLIKRMTPRFDLRATGGVQWLSSGGNPTYAVQDFWVSNYSSFTANGPAYFFDLMPSMNLIPFANHMHRSKFNLYGGLGLGVMHTRTKQTKSFSENEIPRTEQFTTAYIPVRAGLSFTLGPYSEIAGEGTMLLTFTDKLDGNVGFNRYGDHLFQAQLVYRRFIMAKPRD